MSARARRALGASAALAALLLGLAVAAPCADAPAARLDLAPLGGGWSGVDVDPQGARVVLLGDRGRLLTGRLLREGGRLVALDPDPGGGAALRRGPEGTDAEGLDAFAPDGVIVVSFEGFARLRRVSRDAPGAPMGWVVDLPDGLRLGANSGLEALARDAAGRVFTLAERPAPGVAPAGAAFDLLRFDPTPHWPTGTWSVAARLTGEAGWAAVGADFDDAGAFHLLERRFLGWGFASRIRRFDLGPGPGAGPGSGPGTGAPRPGRVLWASRAGRFGNLEGLTLWRGGDGRLRAVMVSDDNGQPWARGALVEVALPEAPARAPSLAPPVPAR